MTASNNAIHRALAALKLPAPVLALIAYVAAIVKAMTGNPHFPSPNPPLATVSAALDALTAAEAQAQTRVKGSVLTRNGARSSLLALLPTLRTYVQSIADASPENGAAIIASAGMAVRKEVVRTAPTFQAKAGAISGTATLKAPAAARRASYDWQYSADGGKTWVSAPSTLGAKTSLAGLPSGSSVMFRYRSVTRAGTADWSALATLLVK